MDWHVYRGGELLNKLILTGKIIGEPMLVKAEQAYYSYILETAEKECNRFLCQVSALLVQDDRKKMKDGTAVSVLGSVRSIPMIDQNGNIVFGSIVLVEAQDIQK